MLDVEAAIKTALRAKDTVALTAYRAVKAKMLLKLTEAGRAQGQPLGEEELAALIRREIRERQESNEFLKPEQPEHAVNSRIIATLEQHLPRQLSAEETDGLIRQVIGEVGAAGPRDMGKVMAALKAKGAHIDMARASARVKELLQAAAG
ncbi:MAG: GatB/YqeY domain-containing protein [Candidatus Lambdaproteobacteria bacterium]|nr:GatB/YqeY domain-containing protein [Candidatus Lambdaproteobacteria bacterium]